MSYFTYEKFQDSYVVHIPTASAVKYNYSFKKLLSAIFKVTNDTEAFLILANNCKTIISFGLYAQLHDDDNLIREHVIGVIGVLVDTEEHAVELIDELDKVRTWALLKK